MNDLKKIPQYTVRIKECAVYQNIKWQSSAVIKEVVFEWKCAKYTEKCAFAVRNMRHGSRDA